MYTSADTVLRAVLNYILPTFKLESVVPFTISRKTLQTAQIQIHPLGTGSYPFT